MTEPLSVVSRISSLTHLMECPNFFVMDDIKFPVGNDLPESLYSRLEKIEESLIQSKNKLDEFEKRGEFQKYISEFDFYTFLKNYYQNRKNAQIVTNAWLKCSEMIVNNNLIGERDRIAVFYNAELPGAFISATNHYCKTHNVQFNWLASSYLPSEQEKKGEALDDKYGLYENYRNNWIMGKDMNGDLTRVDNLLKIKATVLNKFSHGVDLYFSDAGMAVNEDYNRQETINILLNFGQILSGLMVLRRGGSFCTKQYTFFRPLNISLIMLLSNLFESFQIVKPSTSRPANSEVYLIGLDFIGLTAELEKRLLGIFQSYLDIGDIDIASNMTFYQYSPRVKLILDRICEISADFFVENQKSLIDEIVNKINSTDNVELLKESLLPIRLMKEDEYIQSVRIRKLDYKLQLKTKKAKSATGTGESDYFPFYINKMAKTYNSPINYRNIKIVAESLYSCPLPYVLGQVEKAYRSYITKPVKKIIDATGNVGVDTMLLTYTFNKTLEKLTVYEINEPTFNVLSENIKNIGKIIEKIEIKATIAPILGDSVTAIEKLEKGQIDLIYFDPPWGGPGYDKTGTIELRLGSYTIGAIAGLSYGKSIRYVICKVPKNFSKNQFEEEINSYCNANGIPIDYYIYEVDIMNQHNDDVSYRLFFVINIGL
jgi:hypothetical protein